MKITTKRDALFAQLQTVTRAASTRSAVQALSGVQLQAKGGAIELRATDMEIGLRVPLQGEVQSHLSGLTSITGTLDLGANDKKRITATAVRPVSADNLKGSFRLVVAGHEHTLKYDLRCRPKAS